MKTYLVGVALLSLAVAGCQGDAEAIAIDCVEYNPGMHTSATERHVSTTQELDAMRQRPDVARIQDAMQPGWRAPAGSTVLAGLTAPQDGRWRAPGKTPGKESGEYLCSTLFEGAHVCGVDEILKANDKEEFATVPASTEVFVPRDKDVYIEGQKFEGSPTASCDNWTYPTADQRWTGIGVKPETCAGAQAKRLQIDLGPAKVQPSDACAADPRTCPAIVPTGYECNVKRAIACCKS